MSYILDALRKSDQLRQQGAAPTLMSVPLPIQETRQRTLSWFIVLAAVLFILGIIIGGWQPWQSSLTRPVAQPGMSAEEMARRQPGINAPSPAPDSAPARASSMPHDAAGNKMEPVQGTSRQPKDSLVAQAPPATIPAQAVSPGAANPSIPAVAADKSQATPTAPPQGSGPPIPGKQIGTESSSATTEQKIMTRAELPAAVQQEIPKMAVSLHAYSSKPKNRLVSVNDQLLHEGDSLLPGLVLEQITSEDMIFSYKGFRFRQGVH